MSAPPSAESTASDLTETYGIDPHVFANRWRILAVLCLSLVTIVIAVSSLNVAIPTIIESLRPSSTETLWIIEAYALVFAGFLLPAGALGDRFGRRSALLLGLVIFGGMALVASFSTSPAQLIAARAVMGIGAALIMPATLSIITHVFPPHERGRAIATWAGLAGAGGALGPLMSGLALKWFWWGSVFLVNLPLIALLIALVVWLVPNSKDPDGHALDPVGAALSVAMLGSLVFGIIEGPAWGWASPGVLSAFGIAIVSAIGFIKWETTIEFPTLDPRLFKLPGFGMGSLAVTMSFFCMFGMFFLISQYLQFVKGYTALETGVRMLPSAATLILIAPRSPLLTSRLGIRKVIRLGFGLIAAGFVGMATLGTASPYWHVALFLVGLAAGMALVMPPASGLIVSSLPMSKAGVGSAVNDVTREVGGALGIALMGSVMSSLYRSAMQAGGTTRSITGAARRVAEDSIGGATGVTRTLATRGVPNTDAIRQAAAKAYVHGASTSFLVAVAVALIALAVVGTFIPDASAMTLAADAAAAQAPDD